MQRAKCDFVAEMKLISILSNPIASTNVIIFLYLELLIQCGAETKVRTTTQSMTALHVLLLQGKKNAVDTLKVRKGKT